MRIPLKGVEYICGYIYAIVLDMIGVWLTDVSG